MRSACLPRHPAVAYLFLVRRMKSRGRARTEREVRDLFHDHEFIGYVLRASVLVEFDLDILLTVYFTQSDRAESFLERVLPHLTFDRKIRILSQLPLRKSLKTVARIIPGLRHLQKIRNIVAHSAVVSPRRLTELCKDVDVAKLLFDYPASLQSLSQQIRRDFAYLAKLREFRHDSKAETPNATMYGAMKFFERMSDV